MPQPRILSYGDALAETEPGKRHILLANGFSIACRPNIFQYRKLFEQADFTKLPRANAVFAALVTNDFERVIRALQDFAALAGVYYPKGPGGKRRAEKDATALREVLVRTIADSHPARPADIKAKEYKCARAFLSDFERIYTLNYDLLLYWALMQRELEPQIRCDDGFRKPEEEPDASYVTWEPGNTYNQNVYYLHGALHLFDAGVELQKYTWINTQVPLIEQIRAALKQEFYPVFVSEGTSDEKVERIRHNDYLCKMYRSFTEIQGALVVFGHSLDASDDHIFTDRIGRHGKTSRLYVSLHGDPTSASNKGIIRRASALSNLRRGKWHLDVKYFDAETASVWK